MCSNRRDGIPDLVLCKHTDRHLTQRTCNKCVPELCELNPSCSGPDGHCVCSQDPIIPSIVNVAEPVDAVTVNGMSERWTKHIL